MELDPAGDTKSVSKPELSAAIDKLWERFLPEIRERVAVLESAAAGFNANTLTEEQKEEANSAAHKLAGTLGTFNLARGTELARELELVFARNDNPGPAIAGRLAAIANELRALIDSRM